MGHQKNYVKNLGQQASLNAPAPFFRPISSYRWQARDLKNYQTKRAPFFFPYPYFMHFVGKGVPYSLLGVMRRRIAKMLNTLQKY